MKIIETFASIQGESTHAGRRCFFIRLAGCNLRCKYCDTAYAWEGGKDVSIDDLVKQALAGKCDVVEITGGEPLLQSDTPLLAEKLLDANLPVLIETNGSMDISVLPEKVCRILDCKLPDSGMAEHNLYSNYALLQKHDEVKFVVSSRNDFDFALETIRKYDLPGKTANLIISPVWGKVDFAELASWVVACDLPLRMQLQLHKIIWGDRPGV